MSRGNGGQNVRRSEEKELITTNNLSLKSHWVDWIYWQPTGDISHRPSSRLSLLSARPAVTFPASDRHRPWPIPIYTA